MDLSALIFVALAVAWAAYLIPKALKHHEVDRVSRSVDSFSDRVRVLARRDAVTVERAALVVDRRRTTARAGADAAPSEESALTGDDSAPTGDDPAPTADDPATEQPEAAVPTLSPAQRRARRAAAARAARRRRRVFGLVLLVNAAVAGVAAAGYLAWAWIAAPAGLLVAWLVACRLMVRRERAARTVRVRKRRTTLADVVLAEEASDDTDEIPAVTAEEPTREPGSWDPVPVTLPTYVDKAPAGRSVRTIDLDSTGVWSSGRNASDSALAREAEQERSARIDQEERRASGA